MCFIVLLYQIFVSTVTVYENEGVSDNTSDTYDTRYEHEVFFFLQNVKSRHFAQNPVTYLSSPYKATNKILEESLFVHATDRYLFICIEIHIYVACAICSVSS